MDRFLIRKKSKLESDSSKDTDISEINQPQPSTSHLSNPQPLISVSARTSTLYTPIDSDYEKSINSDDEDDDDDDDDDDDLESEPNIIPDLEAETNIVPAKKRKIYDVKYSQNWQMTFKWLREKSGKAFCVSCNKSLAGGKKHLKRHEETEFHKKAVRKTQGTVEIDRALLDTPSRRMQDQVKTADFKLCMFLVEHNLPFLIFDHLPKFICSLPNKDVLKLVKCSRTKATSLINNKLGPFAQILIANILKKTFFSVIIDETTDVSTNKCLVIVVRYFCDKNKKVVDSFFCLIELKEANANAIFKAVIDSFTKHDIPLQNIIGFASDNASVMMGQLNGVKAKFKEILPNIFVIGCLAHSLHLCASNACALLPNCVEDFTRNVYNYFAHSAKRQHEFKEYQQFVHAEPHKLLRPSQTRWLSLEAAVNRILQQWDALTLYFQTESLLENVYGARQILDALGNKEFKLYFYFLSHILKIVNKMNLEFQSETPKIHILLPTITSNYKMILKFYMKHNIVDNLEVEKINPKNPDYFQNIENIYFGAAFEVALEKSTNLLTKGELHQVRLNCLNFYVKLCTEIRTRVDFSDKILNEISNILNVTNIFKANKPSIALLAVKFPNIIDIDNSLEDLNLEWRLLNEYKMENINSLEEVIDHLNKLKNSSGEHIFKYLLILFKAIISLPHGSAAAERIFSKLSLIKTKYRNKLKTETVESLLFSKEFLKNDTCVSWEPNEQLIHFNKK